MGVGQILTDSDPDQYLQTTESCRWARQVLLLQSFYLIPDRQAILDWRRFGVEVGCPQGKRKMRARDERSLDGDWPVSGY